MATEKRLIDAKKLPYSIAVDDNGKQIFYVKAEDIDNAPTVDAVEVVRCKDCIHRHTRSNCHGRRMDFFCADGERVGRCDEN